MEPATSTASAALMSWISTYGYFVLLPLFVIEGPIVGLASGVLISVGALRAVPVFLLYTIGTVITDTLVYYLAKSGDSHLRRTAIGEYLLGQVESVISHADTEWRQKFSDNYFSLMLLAKLAPINLLASFVAGGAGYLRIPLSKFYKPIIIGQPVWSGAIIGLGYYIGGAVTETSQMMSEIAIAAAVFIAFWVYYRAYLHEKVLDSPLGRFLESS